MSSRAVVTPRTRKEPHIPSSTSFTKAKLSRNTPFGGGELWARRLLLRVRSRPYHALLIAIGGGYFIFCMCLPNESVSMHSLRRNVVIEQAAPRFVAFYPQGDTHVPVVRQLDLNVERYPSKRQIKRHEDSIDAQKRLKNSKEHRRGRAEAFETKDCKAQHDWQLTSYPSCNAVHEYDLTNLHADEEEDERVRLISYGYWRDVWMVREDTSNTKRVIKTMRYTHDYVPRNYDRHRRDALAMERLSSSPFVVDIYGFCGNSGVFEYSSEGDINDAIWSEGDSSHELTQLEKLRIATQATIGLAETHNIDKEGQSSIAHTDITPGQYILIDGWFKLNDFNRARFMRWSRDKDEPCGYRVGKNPGSNRSPEEYLYEQQSEKVDVYSLGNIFYMLLTQLWPFEDMSDHEAENEVKEGRRPTVDPKIWNSTDPVNMVLKEAMVRCHRQDQRIRASAREVETLLKEKMMELDPGTIEEWEKRYGRIGAKTSKG